jgi:Family of unknown function (DUF6416)
VHRHVLGWSGISQRNNWRPNDSARAEELCASLHGYTKLFFDFLMDRPGERIDVDEIVTYFAQYGPTGHDAPNRRSVGGSLTPIRRRCRSLSRTLPYEYWPGPNGTSAYALKLAAALLLRDARMKIDPDYGRTTRKTDWSKAEVRATVADYLAMLAAEAAGRRYSKAAHRRKLRQQLSAARTDSAIEYKHQNISAAMLALGLPYIRGYKPMSNYQAAVTAEIQRHLKARPHLLRTLKDGASADTPPVTRLRRTPAPAPAPAPATPSAAIGRRRQVDYGLLQDVSTPSTDAHKELLEDGAAPRPRSKRRAFRVSGRRWCIPCSETQRLSGCRPDYYRRFCILTSV